MTRLVLVTEAVDPHPGRSVTRGIGEENVGKQVLDPRPVVVPNYLLICLLGALCELLPKPGD